MSLVHDALEKAKREASAKSARDLGLPDARISQPFRARQRLHPAVVAAIAAAVTLAAAVGVARWRRTEVERDTAPRSEVARAASAEPAAPPTSPPPTPAAKAAAAPGPTASPAAAPTMPSSPPPVVATQPEPKVAPVAAPPAAPAPPTPVTSAAPAPSKKAAEPLLSFVRQMTLGDGTILRLGGIAWSEEAPLAYLNGKLYAKGESVSGLTIEAIERDRVLLRSASGRISLKLK